MPSLPSRAKLGGLLLEAGLITAMQLNEALARQRRTHERLGEILVNLGALSEEALAKGLSRQLNVPYVTRADGSLAPAKEDHLREVVPEETARMYRILPLANHGKQLTVAVADPLDLLVLDNLRRISGRELSIVIATGSDLTQAIDELYGTDNALRQTVQESYQAVQDDAPLELEELETATNLDALTAGPGIVKLVDLLLREAITSKASDVHIEPYAKQITIRYRIDGILHAIDPPAAATLPAIVSRIKIMSRMDIAEKRLPQDGGFSVKIADRTVDVRVSTVPTLYGEKVVMRLLDKGRVTLDFATLGITGVTLDRLQRAMRAPYGLLFLTGPTGSGKTTTLYTMLTHMDTKTKNVMTIEDPVEYRLAGINQVQAKPQFGLDFAEGLRAFLRQDPDIIMVGEVRDLKTAEICVRAALTGHLVLSTLHTNDAPSAITRLVDLGIEPFLLAPSLVMILAQRLVRRLCPTCKVPHDPTEALQARFPTLTFQTKAFRKPVGCDACRKTGYSGRIGIYEGLYVTETLQTLIAQQAPLETLRQAARQEGMKTLVEDGLQKAAEGSTSIEEVLSSAMIRE